MVMFTLTDFGILLLERRSILALAQRGTESTEAQLKDLCICSHFDGVPSNSLNADVIIECPYMAL